MPAQPAEAAAGGGRCTCGGPDRTDAAEETDADDRTDPEGTHGCRIMLSAIHSDKGADLP